MEESSRGNPFVKLLALSLVINVLFGFLACYALWQWSNLSVQFRDLSASYVNLKQQMNLTRTQLEYYKRQAEYYSGLMASGNASVGVIGHTTVPIVAVQSIQKGFHVEYKGVVMLADVELRAGSGRVLVNTIPKIGIDIQTSVRTGVKVAEEITGVSLGKTDVILTIKASQNVKIVDGPSAGAAITVALIATIRHQSLSKDIYMTGTINSDGSIGTVGGILEKALAAAQNGSKYFFVPKGQANIVVYVPKESHPLPGWTVITYEQKLVNLQTYLKERGYSVNVVEVGTIEEAYSLFSNRD